MAFSGPSTQGSGPISFTWTGSCPPPEFPIEPLVAGPLPCAEVRWVPAEVDAERQITHVRYEFRRGFCSLRV